MKSNLPIVVASRSFSKNPDLCGRLRDHFSNVKFNSEGLILEGENLVRFLNGAQAAIIGLELVTKQVLEKLPKLKIISKYGVGLDNLDLDAMKDRGIQLGWSGGVNAVSVAELTLTLALGLIRKIFRTGFELKQGTWIREINQQLSQKTFGVIGCGHVGKKVIELLKPFQCQILVNDILEMKTFCSQWGATQTGLEELLTRSDIVSLHVPFDQSTQNLISVSQLKMMKKNSFLINTSRGGIVDELALFNALQSQHLAGASCDVFTVEPAIGNPLHKHANFFGTPHIGGSSDEAVSAMGNAAIENLIRLVNA